MSVAIAMFLRPFVVLIVLGLILLPIRYAVIKWMPEGKLKRILLMKV